MRCAQSLARRWKLRKLVLNALTIRESDGSTKLQRRESPCCGGNLLRRPTRPNSLQTPTLYASLVLAHPLLPASSVFLAAEPQQRQALNHASVYQVLFYDLQHIGWTTCAYQISIRINHHRRPIAQKPTEPHSVTRCFLPGSCPSFPTKQELSRDELPLKSSLYFALSTAEHDLPVHTKT